MNDNFQLLKSHAPGRFDKCLNCFNSDCRYGGVPSEILQLRSLEYLALQYHGLEGFPDELSRMEKLTELNLSNNPFLTSLSASLGGFNLKSMYHMFCPIKCTRFTPLLLLARRIPADTRRWSNVGLTLAHRLRRWPNVSPTLDQHLVFAGIW